MAKLRPKNPDPPVITIFAGRLLMLSFEVGIDDASIISGPEHPHISHAEETLSLTLSSTLRPALTILCALRNPDPPPHDGLLGSCALQGASDTRE